MQVDPIEPKLKPPGTKLLKLTCDILVSTSAFKFNLRRYTKFYKLLTTSSSNWMTIKLVKVGRCRLTL